MTQLDMPTFLRQHLETRMNGCFGGSGTKNAHPTPEPSQTTRLSMGRRLPRPNPGLEPQLSRQQRLATRRATEARVWLTLKLGVSEFRMQRVGSEIVSA